MTKKFFKSFFQLRETKNKLLRIYCLGFSLICGEKNVHCFHNEMVKLFGVCGIFNSKLLKEKKQVVKNRRNLYLK